MFFILLHSVFADTQQENFSMKKQNMMVQLIGAWALLAGALLLPLQAQAATTAKPTTPSVEQT